MGMRARERVVAHYSWEQHCREIEQIAQTVLEAEG
jgi:glycosyltransferase involved in cell wall biosynthesis